MKNDGEEIKNIQLYIEPSSVYDVTGISSTFYEPGEHVTLTDRFTPIFRNQEAINRIMLGASESGLLTKNNANSILDFTAVLNTSVNQLSNMGLESGILVNPPSYDFINNPLVSGITIATDNISSLQNGFLHSFGVDSNQAIEVNKNSNVFDLRTSTSLSVPQDYYSLPISFDKSLDFTGTSMPGLKLNNTALDILQGSSAFSEASYLHLGKDDETAQKIASLEEDVRKIKESNSKIIISQVSEKVESLLSTLDDDMAKMFRGAIGVINNPNDDSIAQSAESMTRLLEKLPSMLTPKFKSKGGKRENDIREMLAIHLNIKYKDIGDVKNVLIDMQHHYYVTLSQIRHRNVEIYKKYEDDPFLYKSLLIQIEGFLYQLLIK